ncbi:MAG: potassium channel protein [Deltaproteobacteria bacterium]|nr:potassium channel protein [Deltaproteobacteria bacterium]
MSKIVDPVRTLSRNPSKQLTLALVVLIALTLLGTLGYVLIEGMSPLDALYMTVITLSTVGYAEPVPLSDVGRLYTIGLIVLGIGTAFYAIGALTAFVIEGRLREILEKRSMERTIASLRNHVIVCGFGRFGKSVSEHLRQAKSMVVVIDHDPSVETACTALGCTFLLGSALDDAVLARAAIDRAAAIVAAIPSDSDNVFIALSARDANPDIAIHARAETDAGIRRLRMSGASQIIAPHRLGGQRIANAIVRPGVVEFLELSAPGDGAAVDLEEVVLSTGSRLIGKALEDLQPLGMPLAVIAIKRGSDSLKIRPAADEVLREGDRVVVVGDHDVLGRLAKMAAAES